MGLCQIAETIPVTMDVAFHRSKQDRAEESHDEENGIPRAIDTREMEPKDSIPGYHGCRTIQL
jgi:hypothetical protein